LERDLFARRLFQGSSSIQNHLDNGFFHSSIAAFHPRVDIGKDFFRFPACSIELLRSSDTRLVPFDLARRHGGIRDQINRLVSIGPFAGVIENAILPFEGKRKKIISRCGLIGLSWLWSLGGLKGQERKYDTHVVADKRGDSQAQLDIY